MPSPPQDPPPESREPKPDIEVFTLGPFETNTLLVRPPAGPQGMDPAGPGLCWVVDPSFGPAPVLRRMAELNVRPAAVVLTHAHVDHIAGVADVLRAYPGTPVWVHGAEAGWLNDPLLNLSAMMGMPVTAPGPHRLLADGDTLELGSTRWRVVHTPGHSPGGVVFYHAESGQALSGDAIFAGSIGRTDFPGSDPEELERSIRTRIYTLPDGTRLYPGHGPPTTVGREKRSNPFVRP
jgi:glyoxylase-like metal-dependent hydrolase (beta-lactamase superfamily II)